MTDDFISRWSQRKRAAEVAPEEATEAPAAAESVPSAESEGKDDATLLAELGLKDPDEMGPDDDFAAFIRAALPQRLKTRALRRLWRTDPVLACVDGLNDYDGDFRATNVPEGGLKTAYRVGRGIVRRLAEVEPDAEEAGPVTAPQEPDEVPAEEPPEPPGDTVAEARQNEPGAAEEFAPLGPTRRRMTFHT